jgi:hypothetical protein
VIHEAIYLDGIGKQTGIDWQFETMTGKKLVVVGESTVREPGKLSLLVRDRDFFVIFQHHQQVVIKGEQAGRQVVAADHLNEFRRGDQPGPEPSASGTTIKKTSLHLGIAGPSETFDQPAVGRVPVVSGVRMAATSGMVVVPIQGHRDLLERAVTQAKHEVRQQVVENRVLDGWLSPEPTVADGTPDLFNHAVE